MRPSSIDELDVAAAATRRAGPPGTTRRRPPRRADRRDRRRDLASRRLGGRPRGSRRRARRRVRRARHGEASQARRYERGDRHGALRRCRRSGTRAEDLLACALTALLPPLAEALPRRRLQVACPRPRGERRRQPRIDRARDERPLDEPRRAAGRRRSGARPPKIQATAASRARSGSRDLRLDHLCAQVQQHLRDVDLDRADLVARAAEARGVRQRGGVLDPDELRREDRADRARVHRAVGVTAGARVDRADVEAGAAADAVRAPARPTSSREHARAAVVEQHDVELLRPVALRDAGPERRVRVHPLAGRRARQELQEDLEVGEASAASFSIPRIGHEHGRQRRAHAAVSLRLDDADRARLGDAEVGAADADLRASRNRSRR